MDCYRKQIWMAPFRTNTQYNKGQNIQHSMLNCKCRANNRRRSKRNTQEVLGSKQSSWRISWRRRNWSPEILSRYHHIRSRHKQIQCKTPMEGHQTKPTNKFYSGEKTIKQPSTYSTEKRSRTHQHIQSTITRPPQTWIHRTCPRSEHTSRRHALHTTFSGL